MTDALTVVPADLSMADVRDLLAWHQRDMDAMSPPGTSFALDLSGLDRPDIRMWAARTAAGEIAGIVALKDLGDGVGEIKSMRTAPTMLRRGVGGALLRHLIDHAGAAGYRRLSLETGTGAEFEAATALYLRHGFAFGPVFGDYPADSPHNVFLHRDLVPADPLQSAAIG